VHHLPIPALFLLAANCSDQGMHRIDDDADGAGERLLEVSPEIIDFGQVEAGTVAVDSFTIASVGDAAVELEPLHIHGSGTFTLVGDPLPASLAPGASVVVEVAYEPATSDDHADVIVSSNATVQQHYVDLFGEGVMPELVFDPPLLSLRSYDGNPVYGSLVARNEGVVDLVVDSWVLQGERFEVQTDLPTTLGPGEESIIDVTWYPEVEGTELGYFWAASNDPDGHELATLEGFYQLPCLGLHEADSRGYVDISGSVEGIEITHVGEDLDVCIDRWYVFVSDGTQDAGAGDPLYVETDIYGEEGSIVLSRGDSVLFDYGSNYEPAWWCVEETQQTDTAHSFDFTGAQVPPMLLDTMLLGGVSPNDTVWKDIRENPMMIVGRQRGWATTVSGGSTLVRLEVTNIGREPGSATVSETIPLGMVASDFSPEPDRQVEEDDGAITYSWSRELDAAVDTERDEQTVYDTDTISYYLTVGPEACTVRARVPEPMVQWNDNDGIARRAEGSPFIVECW
jgi:hypothetical protein